MGKTPRALMSEAEREEARRRARENWKANPRYNISMKVLAVIDPDAHRTTLLKAREHYHANIGKRRAYARMYNKKPNSRKKDNTRKNTPKRQKVRAGIKHREWLKKIRANFGGELPPPDVMEMLLLLRAWRGTTRHGYTTVNVGGPRVKKHE